ncbi:hypothetical protein N7532_009932 [Penicillium argentinense]|uniref:Uncharacterized protein n=1 Tax=Penicillium argentinense TaxID=1131581 RepID=A0A9W9ENQ4_9EURO|nr:uncharacterized protein N7532_009932 [Penicillium argentinense]KAJ5085161.1 hypothetical protein N7532_009932 [Penicillium argentinense]
MVQNRQKPQDLQVPLPTFPLSSPISEEIESPSCSSAEDRDLERTRPFDFLVKATRQKVESRQAREGRQPSVSHRDRHGDGLGSRLSIRGITRKRKNAAKPVGLNLVTDFSLAAPPKKKSQDGPVSFVDLNDLKMLSKAREEERTTEKTQAQAQVQRPLRSNNPFMKDTSRSQQVPETQRESPIKKNPFLDPNLQDPFSDRYDDGISPSDRHVMIGLTVPRNDSLDRTRERESAGDQHTPLTPSIIVTPAREEAPWSTSSPETHRPRATSSVYSQPTPQFWQDGSDIPPVPAIPDAHRKAVNSDFLSAHFNAMTKKRRSMSADTIFEDNSPEEPPRHSQVSIDDNDQAPLASRLSVNTEGSRRQSQGWWTYILSPLLGKRSPISPSFPLGGSTSASSSKGTREWWEEKEISHFSPDTPQTAVINWDEGIKNLEQSRSLEADEKTIVSKRQTIMSMMFPGGKVQGEAAEYYQACAHELFSKTPYFECFNHICSITPPDKIPAPIDDCPGETRDRALIFAEGNASTAQTEDKKDHAVATSEIAAKGLLIDIDSPKVTNDQKHIKEIPSPASSSSSDSWDSSLASPREKDLPDPPQDATRGVTFEPVPQPPVHAPAPQEPMQPPIPEPTPTPMPPAPQEIPHQPQAQPPQIIHNYYGAPQEPIPASRPEPVEQPVPRYVPIFPPNHEMPPPVPQTQPSEWPKAPTATERGLDPDVPQSHAEQQPHHTNEPISPGFQRAAAGPGAIQLSEVHPGPHNEAEHDINAPAPAYTQYPREFPRETPLPPRYDLHPAPGAVIMDPTGPAGPMEARRRRLEREDAAGRKVGGLWRGRGCFSNKGCFGRPGREGRLRRRWYLFICTLFLIIIIVAIVLATTLTREGNTTPVQSNWLNLTGYPPVPTGIATIAGTEAQNTKSTCIKPSSLWSCALPKDEQSDNKPYAGNEPTFRVQILFRNGSYDNSTAVSSSSKTRRDNINWNASPATPDLSEQVFLGNTTDGNSEPYAGEETPFYMTILSPVHLSSTNVFRRSTSNSSNSFPNLTTVIPAPSENSDGTASAATLYPLPESQPVRLYNRNQDNEHYGFYTYFDKSIFLASDSALNGGTKDNNEKDKNGGSTKSDARVRCTWSQTRFLVQIWTKPSRIGRTLLSSGSNGSSSTSAASTPTSTSSTSTSSSSAADYARPGSFPYPVTISLDRHGGTEKKKLVYCYGVGDDGHYNITNKKLQVEDRGIGGTLVNPASGIFDDVDKSASENSTYGGIDGGTGGCGCQWVNWISTS